MEIENSSLLSPSEPPTPQPRKPLHMVLAALAALYVLVSGGMILGLRSRVFDLEQWQAGAKERQAQLDAKLKITSETLASQLGSTQQQMTARTAQLERSQKAAESRITTAQKEQIQRVNNQMEGVATEVGAVKTDVASTRSDLEITKAKLERTIGDLNIQSGLIARTHDDLEILKHKGDRNYFEFTLEKGKHPTPVSTVSLQLKKVDRKHNRFTMNVIADDKTIEKKDRTLFEPLQFYTGRDRMLYELVVNDVQKDKVSGYVATPKNAPQPVTQ